MISAMRRIVSVAVMGMGVLLLLAAGGWLYFSNQVSQPGPAPLPNEVAGLSLSMKMTGAQATEEFATLHNNHFPLTSGAVGTYGNQQIGLWVGGAPFNLLATRLVIAMHDKIAEGNSPFTPVREFEDRGRVVYGLEGMGQKHYYFQSQNLVIWLASDPAFADKALPQILEAYP